MRHSGGWGGNAELRAWKAFGHWVNTIRQASQKSVIPEHALYAASKIVIFIQCGDTLSKKVMEDLGSSIRARVCCRGRLVDRPFSSET